MDWYDTLRELRHSEFWQPIVSSIVLATLLLLLRRVAHQGLARTGAPVETRRRWLIQLRTGAALIFCCGLVVIWADELRTVALSLVAFAAAIALAVKELLMCISGAILRGVSRGFTLGDRIEVGNFRGDVIDMGVMTTTLLDVGPGAAIHQHTGRAIVLPNSIWLSAPVVNVSFTDEFVLHVLAVPCSATEDVEAIEDALLEAAREECASYFDEAKRYLERLGLRRGIDTPSVEPRVWIKLASPAQIELLLRFPAPARLIGRVEQGILRRYLRARADPRAQEPAAAGASEAIAAGP
ncbi:MAG: mechanosensitive ion channel family protein [Nannocystaceae bacterium]